MEKYDDALSAFKQGIQLSRDLDEFSENWMGVGAVYYKRELYQAALEAFLNVNVENLTQGKTRYWEWKGDCHYFLNQPDQALLSFSKGLELDPNQPILWQNRGNVYLQLQQYETALAAFKKVSEMRPEWFLGWCGMGTANRELGKYHQSLDCYEKALDLNPDYWLSWAGKAQAHFHLHQYHMALHAIDKALAEEPDYPRGQVVRQKALHILN